MKCPACQTDNPDSQNFCGQCGVRLRSAPSVQPTAPTSYTPAHLAERILTSRSALEGERKLVTVLFCDIAQSTQLAVRVGADAMHALLNRFFELALSEVHRFEGTINQFLGDGFMALFGAPLAHEDHARRALLAALAIQQRLRDSGEAGLSEVRVRIGVNTGMVVVGRIGDNLRMDYTAVGDTTNLAARLQQSAQPGAIWISQATQRASASHFEFRPLGKQTFRGKAEPLHVYELLKTRSAAQGGSLGQTRGIGSPLVGREHEQSVLTASLARLRRGKGGIVILAGEPGVGKSRLMAEVKRQTDAIGILWLEGRSLSFGRNLSYWPFIEILKQCFAIEGNDTEAQAWRKLEHHCAALFDQRAEEIVPYLGTVLAKEPSGLHEGRVKYLDPQALRRQVFLSMRQLFEALAKRQPVLLLMEDWHWTDHSSAALCEHLLPLAGSNPLLFWFAARPDPGQPLAQIRGAAAGGEREVPVDEIALVPLGEEQSTRLLDNLVGMGQLPAPLRREILRKTEGNPFFMEELIRALIADGALVEDPDNHAWRLAQPVEALTLPDTIQGVILARIDRLEEGLKGVLKLASVIGRSFFLRILGAISDAGQALDKDLGQLEEAELIRLRQRLPEMEYIFKHALVQEAAYGSIVVERRRAIHRSVAEAIERLFSDRLEEFVSVLAYHYARAEDWDKAQAYLFKAGDQAGRMAADAEALEHYRQAEAVYIKVAARDITPLQRAQLDRKLGQAYFGIGEYDRAVEHFTRALSHVGLQYPRSRWGVRVSMLRLLGAHFLRRSVLAEKRAYRLVWELEVAQEVAVICQSLVWLDFFLDEERMAVDGLMELYVGERSGDVVAHARGLGTLGLLLMLFGALPLARKKVAEAVAMAQSSQDDSAIGGAFFIQGWVQWTAGSLVESERSFEKSLAAYKAIGDIRGWGGPTVYLCYLVGQTAQFTHATKLAYDLIEAGQDAGDPHVELWGLQALGNLGITLGPLDEAAAHLAAARDMSTRLSSLRLRAMGGGILGKCHLRQGKLIEAEAVLTEAVGIIAAKNLRGFQSADPLNAYAELCLINAGRLSGAARRRALRKASRACRKALRCARSSVTWLPEAHRLHGTQAWLAGDAKSAKERWSKSIATAQGHGLQLDQARTLLEMGDRLADASLVDEAIVVFEQTGAKVYLAVSLHVRARLQLKSGADTERVLASYDAAITVLEEVRAEYELGLARWQRSKLHEHLGRLEQARADQAAARKCLSALGESLDGMKTAEGEVTAL